MKILKRDSLKEGGFAGLKEHRLIKDPVIFGSQGNEDGSWPGLENFVYLADARFLPHGETRMHSHHEIDVISLMVEGNIKHEGSLEHGKSLSRNEVQVQSAGGEGFSHNEINPDDSWNRMIQLWALPEVAGQPARYKVYKLDKEGLTRIYGSDKTNDSNFASKTKIDVGMLSKDQQINVDGVFLAYITRGKGTANNEQVADGDLIRGGSLEFKASEDVQLIVIHTSSK
ncbi:MAG: pirin family protein [Pseudomonadota bacterium]